MPIINQGNSDILSGLIALLSEPEAVSKKLFDLKDATERFDLKIAELNQTERDLDSRVAKFSKIQEDFDKKVILFEETSKLVDVKERELRLQISTLEVQKTQFELSQKEANKSLIANKKEITIQSERLHSLEDNLKQTSINLDKKKSDLDLFEKSLRDRSLSLDAQIQVYNQKLKSLKALVE